MRSAHGIRRQVLPSDLRLQRALQLCLLMAVYIRSKQLAYPDETLQGPPVSIAWLDLEISNTYS
jgi:hypothetical protein